MSTASGGSSESSSFQPQAKKFRSPRNDMNHMSFDSANSDSDLSALGDILYSNHNPPAPITSPSPLTTTHHDTDTSVLPAALPDSNTQYKVHVIRTVAPRRNEFKPTLLLSASAFLESDLHQKSQNPWSHFPFIIPSGSYSESSPRSSSSPIVWRLHLN